MKCAKCNSNTEYMYDEKFDCVCGHVISVAYYVCSACGFVFRIKDGEFMDGEAIDEKAIEAALESMFKSMVAEMEDDDGPKLSDLIHKCIRCGAVATEINKNCFVCTSCDFEWEVDDHV